MNAETKKVIRKDYWIYIMLIVIGIFVVHSITSQLNVRGKVVDKKSIELPYHGNRQYLVFVETQTPRGRTVKKKVSVNSTEWHGITEGQLVCLNCSTRYIESLN